jgi:NNP family nitrate/nitrite transporter-like MFS transporter
MVVPGVMLLLMAWVYWKFTADSPEGNYDDLRGRGAMASSESVNGTFLEAAKDVRVWALFVIYGACFGIELTINNVAALYYYDYFDLDLRMAGLVASLFGLMNIFARTLGGYVGDRFGRTSGPTGRVRFMGAILLAEGLALMLFSRMDTLLLAIGAMLVFSLCVQMSEGATYSVVPFVNKRALGSVAGIVGAGGNAGAVAAGFLFRSPNLSWPTAFLVLGGVVTGVSALSLVVRFSPEDVKAGSTVRADESDAREGARGWIPEAAPAPEAG